MKKTAAFLAVAVMFGMSAYASPQTEFTKGRWEINAGMWNTKAKTRTYKDNGAWNFNGGVTYSLTDKTAAQYQYYGLNSDDTDGRSHELNLLYSIHPQVAVYTGYNHITMSDFPTGAFGVEKRGNDIAQIGVIARHPINEVLDLYAKGAIGSKNTSIWETGVNFAFYKDIDLNAGYRYLNTEGSRDKNVSYQGWLAGVSYHFGGSDRKGNGKYSGNIDYSALSGKGYNEGIGTVTVTPTKTMEKETTTVPENDYYFNSIHFGNDSDDPGADQKANLDAFVKAAKETGHTFKLVGRTDSNGSKEYNDDLAIRRIKKVAAYAVAHGVNISRLVGMYKGEETPTDTNDTEAGRANNRRVDIFEHK